MAKKDVYTAALVVIGNEILSGRTVDSNTPWIAERLTARGIVLAEVRVIPDTEAGIIDTVNALRATHDYVFTTGGIGPTHDDITSEAIAKALGMPLELNAAAMHALEEHYGAETVSKPRAKMAMIPRGAVLIPNPVSAAPGYIAGNVYVMAGVPRIMQGMLDQVLGMIDAGKPVLSSTITCKLGESVIAEDLSALQDRYPAVQIGSYPHYRGGTLGLSLVVRSTEQPMLEEVAAAIVELIRKHGDEPRTLSIKTMGKAQYSE